MTRNAHMFITGPEVIKAVTGRTTTMEEVGGAAMHGSVSGNVHFVAEDDRHALQIVQRLSPICPPTTPRIRRIILGPTSSSTVTKP